MVVTREGYAVQIDTNGEQWRFAFSEGVLQCKRNAHKEWTHDQFTITISSPSDNRVSVSCILTYVTVYPCNTIVRCVVYSQRLIRDFNMADFMLKEEDKNGPDVLKVYRGVRLGGYGTLFTLLCVFSLPTKVGIYSAPPNSVVKLMSRGSR